MHAYIHTSMHARMHKKTYIYIHSTVCIRYTYVHFHACLCLYPITCLGMSSCFQSSNPQNICWLIPRWIFAWILDLRNASRCQNWMGTSTEASIFDVILLVSRRFSQATIWCQKTMVSCKIFPHTRSQDVPIHREKLASQDFRDKMFTILTFSSPHVGSLAGEMGKFLSKYGGFISISLDSNGEHEGFSP